MPNAWTAEQILALAPDTGSLKAGQEQSTPRRWITLGSACDAVWGLCQGSAKDPYRTQIDLGGPAFRCTCPSRKFPCKHAIGLFLLLAARPEAFESSQPPAWVAEWLESRRKRSEPAAAAAPVQPAANAEAQARRQAQREARVAAGIAELELWIQDLLRQGFGALPGKELRYWETAARRLVDAQAPGLARHVRLLAALPSSGQDWQGRLLDALGRIHLLLRAYQRLEDLPPLVQADVRAQIGWTVKAAELLERQGLRDEWLVVARRIDEEGSNGHTLQVQRVWLWGRRSQRPALVLNFAAAGQPLDAGLLPGSAVEAELVYYPSAAPLRALVKARFSPPHSITALSGAADLSTLAGQYAAALAACPWLENWPGVVEGVVPFHTGEIWRLVDAAGRSVPLASGFSQAAKLLAISGGHPLALFGEWDGSAFLPLSCMAGAQWHSLTTHGENHD